MPAKKRTASQTRWLQEHFSDPYVKQAHKLGLRSRASFKLEELQKVSNDVFTRMYQNANPNGTNPNGTEGNPNSGNNGADGDPEVVVD